MTSSSDKTHNSMEQESIRLYLLGYVLPLQGVTHEFWDTILVVFYL